MTAPPEPATVWLDRQRPVPPPRLRARMFEALAATPEARADGAAPARACHMAEAAVGILDRLTVPQTGGGRASGPDRALDLLAADALLTAACEAAGEVGEYAVLAIVEQYGPRRLAQLLSGDEAGEVVHPSDAAGGGRRPQTGDPG